MARFYEKPKIEVMKSADADIITTSGRRPIIDGGNQEEYEEGIKWDDLFA